MRSRTADIDPTTIPDGAMMRNIGEAEASVDLRERGIDEVEAADLRRRLARFA